MSEESDGPQQSSDENDDDLQKSSEKAAQPSPDELEEIVAPSINFNILNVQPSEAETLERLEKVVPGITKKLMDERLSYLQHDRSLDLEEVEISKRAMTIAERKQVQSELSTRAATFIAVLAISAISLLGMNGKPWAAGALAGGFTAVARMMLAVQGKSDRQGSEAEKP
ncbi:MAG: hypothetical protein AAFY11_10960 [Cyanobacteria bacterium J06641_5]